jgi:colanic acid/amylovoran biosynthesis glycosyltransferase
MRVVHFVRAFSPLSQTFIYDYIDELQRQRVDCRVLTFVHENEQARPFEPVTVVRTPRRTNVRRVFAKAKSVFSGPESRVEYEDYVKRLGITSYLRDRRPDLIHAHFGPAGALVAPVAARLQIPLVVTFYGYDVSRLARMDEWRCRYERLSRLTERVTVLSDAMKSRILELGFSSERASVIHLGKRLSSYPFREPSRRVRRLITVGRLVEKKGHLDLLLAIRILLAQGRDLALTVIGSGPLEHELRDYVRRESLGDRVQLLGALPHPEVISQMQQADAFVLCSKTSASGDEEGTPTVLLEAQALGLPCVSTSHAGIPEMIPSENHWLLAREGDIGHIGERIAAAADCAVPDLRSLSVAGREWVEERFSLEKEVRRLRDLYAAMSS